MRKTPPSPYLRLRELAVNEVSNTLAYNYQLMNEYGVTIRKSKRKRG